MTNCIEKQANPHRILWEALRGTIQNSLWVLHKCDNRKCFNIDHLYLGTPTDNNRDTVSRGRHRWAGYTHCKYGHSDWGIRKWNNPKGRTGRPISRYCKACNRIKSLEAHRRKKGG